MWVKGHVGGGQAEGVSREARAEAEARRMEAERGARRGEVVKVWEELAPLGC